MQQGAADTCSAFTAHCVCDCLGQQCTDYMCVEFIVLFLTRFNDSTGQAQPDSPSALASKSYKSAVRMKIGTYCLFRETLAHYHGWFLKKTVGVALYSLSSHKAFADDIYSETVTTAVLRCVSNCCIALHGVLVIRLKC